MQQRPHDESTAIRRRSGLRCVAFSFFYVGQKPNKKKKNLSLLLIAYSNAL